MASGPQGYQKLTVSNTALNLTIPGATANNPSGKCTKVAIRVETAAIRYRDDGTAPTASDGIQILTTDPIFVYDGDLTKIQVIRATGSDGTLFALYYN